MKRNSNISSFLKDINLNPYQAYLTNEIQVADLLDWILDAVGKSEIWQTSFSISDEFLRRLFFIEKKGKVEKFHLILDLKATNKTLKLWPFISQIIADTYLSDNHSKILLVKAQNGKCVSVITSQNLTRGNRMESAFITTDVSIFDTLYSQINNLISNHSVPFNDIFTRSIKTN